MSEALSVDPQALAKVPDMITTVRQGVASVQSLASSSAAMGATGSMAASAAIGTFGAGIGFLLAELVEALDADADGLRQSVQRYAANEQQCTGEARSILDILGDLLSPPAPRRAPVATRHGASGSW